MDFPFTPDDVTSDWFSKAIGESFGDTARELDLNQIGKEQGASALIYRADITWHDQSNSPNTLIFKFASTVEDYRRYAQTMGTYLKEVRFYQSFGSHSAIPLPRTYFSAIDESSGYFLIVMEDLSAARTATWFADGVEDVQLALEHLARIHAEYWNDATLDELPWLGRTDDLNQSHQYKTLLEQLLPAARKALGNHLSDYSWSTLAAWLENWEAVRAATSRGPKTLVHREADMRQMFFPTHEVDRFVLYDWQSPEIGWGAADACRVIVTSLNLATRRQHEHSLVEYYAGKLQGNGVADKRLDSIWREIKLSLLMNVLAHLFTLLWVEKEETAVWQRSHLGMLGNALEDWQLLEVIKAESAAS